MAVVSLSKSLRQSIINVYSLVPLVRYDDMVYRTDIAQKALNQPIRLGILGSTRGTDMNVKELIIERQ